MNCRRAQSEIALWAGNDLDEIDLQCLQRHLEACPECQEYQEQMHALMRLVEECPLREEADAASKLVVEDSLWPGLSTRLVAVRTRRNDHFNGWVPAVAVAAVCLAMVLIASPPQATSPQEVPASAVASEGEWSREGRKTSLSEPASSSAPQRIQEPLPIFPVGDRPLPPRFVPPNFNEAELIQRQQQELNEFRSLLRRQREFPQLHSPEEIQRRFQEFEKLHSLLMNQYRMSKSQ